MCVFYNVVLLLMDIYVYLYVIDDLLKYILLNLPLVLK